VIPEQYDGYGRPDGQGKNGKFEDHVTAEGDVVVYVNASKLHHLFKKKDQNVARMIGYLSIASPKEAHEYLNRFSLKELMMQNPPPFE
jgi:3-deoxy-D-arabino-heptulosonate 7-phosphate (DAHP) synthase